MKPILHFLFIPIFNRYLSKIFVLIFFYFNFSVSGFSQVCGSGYTRDTLNWDNMEYFHRNGGVYGGTNPVTMLPFVTTTQAQIQYFAFGTNKLTINSTMPVGSASSVYGDVTEHTGDVAGYAGADIKYVPTVNGQLVTLVFRSEVTNTSFSLYDIDRNAVYSITAFDAGNAAQIVNITYYGATILSTGGTPTARTITATNTALGVTLNTGTATISVPTLTDSIRIVATAIGTDAAIYLSDITACTPDPGFPATYYSLYTTPYTGQPGYFLANPQNLHVYRISPTGEADFLFSDPGGSPAGSNKMNSLAYDPVNHWLYYTMDNASMYPGNLVLKKYDFTTGTISTVIPNINTFGLPSFIQGVEYAGAAFFNGSLYLGIEGSDGTSYSTFGESVVWRIDFNSDGTTNGYCMAFGTPGDIGTGTPRHDWGDFIIRDGGIIVTHATGPTTTSNHYIHYNMQTGVSTTYNSAVAIVAGQLGQTYNGNAYRINNGVALYNNDGSVGAISPVAVTSCSPAWVGNAGDASDPFLPMQDFGDAPVSYDPVALSVAANQKACNNSTLRIGASWGDEWIKNILTTDASGDDEEDGITTVTVMVSDGIAYNHVQEVTVLNNTSGNAYLAAWLDYDADGVFEASEGVVMTIGANASPQLINLEWTGITVAIGTPNSFVRVRLSSTPITVNDATGWFVDGETEDYPVISQSMPLAVQVLDFNAVLTRDKDVLLNWKAYADQNASGFEVERSKDQNTWESIGQIDVNSSAYTSDYSLLDQQPMQGKSYYRLKLVEKSGSSRYSSARLIQLDMLITKLNIYPNPAKKDFTISFNSAAIQTATLTLRSVSGEVMIKRSVSLNQGDNRLQISTDKLSNGLYLVELITAEKTFTSRLTVAH